MNDAIKMQISAFVDGELPQNEAELLLRRMCQDRNLRQQAAEYLSMGRLMRGERRIAGMDKLRERISAALNDTALQDEIAATVSASPRYLRPLAGAAIAATVALAVLLGLQQIGNVGDDNVSNGTDTVAEAAEDSAYTVPLEDDNQLRDYYLRHSESSSYIGANSINARLVTLELREGVVIEVDTDEQTVDEDTTDDALPAESAGRQAP